MKNWLISFGENQPISIENFNKETNVRQAYQRETWCFFLGEKEGKKERRRSEWEHVENKYFKEESGKKLK